MVIYFSMLLCVWTMKLCQIKLCQVLKDGLSAVHVPYAYGFAIILLTIIVKVATFPLTKQQVSRLCHDSWQGNPLCTYTDFS